MSPYFAYDSTAWLLPNLREIAQGQPDLIMDWQFPHQFHRLIELYPGERAQLINLPRNSNEANP